MRLFVALELPADVRALLAAAEFDREVWRPVAEESLHLTLAFLGRRDEADVPAIAAVLAREAGSPAPRLELGAALLLPPRRARVLTLEVADPDGTLAALQARVSHGLHEAGLYAPEKRPYRAHATIARLRPGARAPREAGVELQAGFRGGPLTLFESRLHPSGARYAPLERIALAQ
jgi:RNA 2',3'-cyclic 3'-phosphodiesterase